MDEVCAQFGFQHPFDSLEVIGEVGAVHIGLLRYPHDSAYLTVLRGIHHHEGLRHLAFVEVIDLLGDLRREVLVLKAAAAGVGVDHQTGVHHGVLILREADDRLLKLNTVRLDELAYGVQPLDGVDLIRGADTRTEEDMAAVDALAFLLDELDDMVSVFGLHDTAHAFGIVEVKSHLGELADELSAAYEP